MPLTKSWGGYRNRQGCQSAHASLQARPLVRPHIRLLGRGNAPSSGPSAREVAIADAFYSPVQSFFRYIAMRRPSPEVCPLVAISRQSGTAIVIIDLDRRLRRSSRSTDGLPLSLKAPQWARRKQSKQAGKAKQVKRRLGCGAELQHSSLYPRHA